ncbi:MAG TPA: ECF-type sigma factor [Vicinamibacterales bacterium]|jgi:RNA polymerase sigma factor (TIGR02999 family)
MQRRTSGRSAARGAGTRAAPRAAEPVASGGPRGRGGPGGPGGPPDADALLPAVYAELRRLAAHYLRGERPGQTLQPTALVHEAYLKLQKDRPERWQNRAHFCAIAAHTMRQVLVERARARDALKRGGGAPRVTFDEALPAAAEARGFELVTLDAALERLAALDADQARLVELRFFGGLSIEETAEAMHLSPATVKRRWALARAWLARELQA